MPRTIRAHLRRYGLDAWLDLVLPTDCIHCGRPLTVPHAHGLCGACWSALAPVPPDACPGCALPRDDREDLNGRSPPFPRCRRCRARPLGADGVRAATVYRGPARALVLAAKGRLRPEILASLAPFVTTVARRPGWPEPDVVVPVPTSRVRTLRRGFDPAAVLAGPVAAALGRPLDCRALRRRLRNLRATKGLAAPGREAALADAFVARPRRVGGRSILLVDDVVTTGNTVRASCRALRDAGARSVQVACWARTLL